MEVGPPSKIADQEIQFGPSPVLAGHLVHPVPQIIKVQAQAGQSLLKKKLPDNLEINFLRDQDLSTVMLELW